jgi:hypothetical protein
MNTVVTKPSRFIEACGALAAVTEHLLTALKQLREVAARTLDCPARKANFWAQRFEAYFFGRKCNHMYRMLSEGHYPIGFLREKITQINELIANEDARRDLQCQLITCAVQYADSAYDVERF